jgi:hypothetical protein
MAWSRLVLRARCARARPSGSRLSLCGPGGWKKPSAAPLAEEIRSLINCWHLHRRLFTNTAPARFGLLQMSGLGRVRPRKAPADSGTASRAQYLVSVNPSARQGIMPLGRAGAAGRAGETPSSIRAAASGATSVGPRTPCPDPPGSRPQALRWFGRDQRLPPGLAVRVDTAGQPGYTAAGLFGVKTAARRKPAK